MTSTLAEQRNQNILKVLKQAAYRMLDRTSDQAENVLSWKDSAIAEIVTAENSDRYQEDAIYDTVWNDLYTEASLVFHLFDRAQANISYHRLGRQQGVLVIYNDGYDNLKRTFIYPIKGGSVQVELNENNQPL